LWDHLKRKLSEQEVAPRGILELWERVKEEWNKIDAEVCQNLIESMPRRVEAVLKAKVAIPSTDYTQFLWKLLSVTKLFK